MKIDLTSMAFGYSVADGRGTPNWATALGQGSEYKIEERSGSLPLLPGLIHKSVSLDTVKVKKGKGGKVFVGSDAESGVVLASLFSRVFVNGIFVPGGEFLLYIDKDSSSSHFGRLRLKYSPFATFETNGIPSTNEPCITKMAGVLGLDPSACWFVHDIDIQRQDELHFSAVVVDAKNSKHYGTIADLNREWSNLTPSPIAPTTKPAGMVPGFSSAVAGASLIYEDFFLKRFVAALLAKPFVILTGLSGSGKTKLAEAFAKWLATRFGDGDGSGGQYLLVPVGADWSNNEHLLGYPDALHPGAYVMPETEVLQFVLAAAAHKDDPYFLILDEMNLSHVERYFADFLSAMESSDRTIHLHGGKDASATDAESANDENPGTESPVAEAPNAENHEVPTSLKLPDNLFVIGTMNVDETTYMVSPKVLDRAQVLEFRVSHEDIESFLAGAPAVDMEKLKDAGGKPLGESFAAPFLTLARRRGVKPPWYLVRALNPMLLAAFDELSKLGAEFSFRSTAEIVAFAAFANECGLSIRETIDAAILQKLLPKVHGSRRKLESPLGALWNVCRKKGDKTSLPETREQFAASFYTGCCRLPWSGEKIARMYRQAVDNGFASFAEA